MSGSLFCSPVVCLAHKKKLHTFKPIVPHYFTDL